jgi:hypothetical protein
MGDLLREQGLRATDEFDELIARAPFLECWARAPFPGLVAVASGIIANRAGLDPERLRVELTRQTEACPIPHFRAIAMPHARLESMPEPHLLLVRCRAGIRKAEMLPNDGAQVRAIMFVVSPTETPDKHLRLLGHLATHVSEATFLEAWLAAQGEHQVKETLLRVERSLSLTIGATAETHALAGVRVTDALLPKTTLIALVRRGTEILIPSGATILEKGDRITILGSPQAIRRLSRAFGVEGPSRLEGDTMASQRLFDGILREPSLRSSRPPS